MKELERNIILNKEFIKVCKKFSDVLKVNDFNEYQRRFIQLDDTDKKAYINDLYNYLYEKRAEEIAEEFDGFLNEIEEPIILGGITYNYSVVYKRTDEVAYNMAKQAFVDSQMAVLDLLQDIEEC